MFQSALHAEIVQEIAAVSRESSKEKRIEVLRGVTDLFVGAAMYAELDASLFDDVMNHLMDQVEDDALAELSARLAPIANAPPQALGRLARNDDIAIAGPVLTQSRNLSDYDLVEIATMKSQEHLAIIARRPDIPEGVAEVLIDRGNADVANAVARNPGAHLSSIALARLAMRAVGDERLIQSIVRRSEVVHPVPDGQPSECFPAFG